MLRLSSQQFGLIAVIFALAVATSAQATPLAPLHQPDGMITQVREAYGAGMHMVNGQCIRTSARRNAARCAVGMRTVGARCVK
jgi:hypothetical protein